MSGSDRSERERGHGHREPGLTITRLAASGVLHVVIDGHPGPHQFGEARRHLSASMAPVAVLCDMTGAAPSLDTTVAVALILHELAPRSRAAVVLPPHDRYADTLALGGLVPDVRCFRALPAALAWLSSPLAP